MPRLSVDIDLTYVPLNTREEALGGISKALKEISSQARKHLDAQVVLCQLPGCKRSGLVQAA